MASPPGSTAKAPKDQYHHVIPRFILREFQIGPKKTKRERNRDYRKLGFVDEKVWFYDVEKHTLEQRLVSGVYGVNNLYRDAQVQDVDEIEKKLSMLENTSARILRDIHDVIDKPRQNGRQSTFSINRGDLEHLRKFLFIMHYRSDALSQFYFSAEHPENAPIADKIKRMGKRLNLKTPGEMWLHFLRYYLDTPHSQMELEAIEGMPETVDIRDYIGHLSKAMLDPDAENGVAITYHTQVGGYYLNIVQAASEEEFVLGHNSFGLWEGVMGTSPGIHRLYVISPRIAFILRTTMFHNKPLDALDRILCRSDLLEIQLPGAVCSKLFDESMSPRDMLDYKASIQAKNDQYQFPITKLTKRQTHLINSVVMLNARREGSLTFLTPQIMRSTVRTLWRSKHPGVRIERHRYMPLIRQLTYTSPAISGNIAKPATKVIRLPAPPGSSSAQIRYPASPPPPSAVPTQSTSSHPPAEVRFPSSFGRPDSIAGVDDYVKLAEKTLFETIDHITRGYQK